MLYHPTVLSEIDFNLLLVDVVIGSCFLFQSDDSEIDADEDDEEDEEGEEEEERREEDESLEVLLSRSNRPPRGGVRPALLEESDDDF